MGLAANQARLLTLTARMHDLECRVMCLSAEKMVYAMQQIGASQAYNAAMNEAEAMGGEQVITGYNPVQKSRKVNGSKDVKVTGAYLIDELKYQFAVNQKGSKPSTPKQGDSVDYKATYNAYNQLPTTESGVNNAGLSSGDIVLVQTDSTHSNKSSYYQLSTEEVAGNVIRTKNPDYDAVNLPKTPYELLALLQDKFHYVGGSTPNIITCEPDPNGDNCNIYDLQHVANKDIIDARTGKVYAEEGEFVSLKDLAATLGNTKNYTSIGCEINLDIDKFRAFFNIPEYIETQTWNTEYEWTYYGEANVSGGNSGDQNEDDPVSTITESQFRSLPIEEIIPLVDNRDIYLISPSTGNPINNSSGLPTTYKETTEETEYYTEYEPVYGTDYSKRDAKKRKAQSAYDTASAEISMQEKILDLKMTSSNTELSSCNKEYDSVKSLIGDNVEKGFKLFS